MFRFNSSVCLRLISGIAGVLLLTAAYYRVQSASVMADTARAFLNSLTPDQKSKATYPFPDEERFDWHFIPKPRKGLPLRDMTSSQRKLAHALLSAGLSQRGYIKATEIMSLEEVLRALENGKGPVRDPDGYFFTIFGEPSENGTWGYRVEGHHLSQNFTVVNGKIAASPSFFGSNPAEVKDGQRKGLRVLAREDDLGLEMIAALTPEQKKSAIVDPKAYPDILTMASRKAALKGQPSGLEISRLTGKQRALFQELLDEYCQNMPEQLAQAREDAIKKAGNHIYFAWAGQEKLGTPHYYRIQAPTFLIEFDDTQDNANHIHSVWRDFDGDFGLDLLQGHYQTSHK